MTADDLVGDGEEMHEALSREEYLTGAGLKSDPQFQEIYERFAHLAGAEALDAARATGDPALIEWLVNLRVGRETAEGYERQLKWEQQAILHVDGRAVPYLRAPIELQNSPDRAFRLALDRARATAGADGLNSIVRDRLLKEHDLIAALGFGDYVEARRRLSGVDYEGLAAQTGAFLAATEAMYTDSLARLVKHRLGSGLEGLDRSDVAWTFRADRFDASFQPGPLMETAIRQMGEMGLDATEEGRVRIDIEERPGKQPRAFCAPVRVPHEVYLVVRLRGGHTDYRTFWHELGHAMHFAAVDADRPFAHRWLGDNSVTEGFAMLWDHLTIERGWLERYAPIAASQIRELLFELAVNELYMLRRYAAKIQYELVLHRQGPDNAAPAYAELLSNATRFRFRDEDYLLDVDPAFYAARYLRAWQLEAALDAHLTATFDDDWFRNPRAGAFVRDLMRRGQADPADVLAQEIGRPLGFDEIIKRLESVLN